VISIGALAAHPLWGERSPVRTGHATTVVIKAGDARILVDPGLPAQALVPRLGERANLTPSDITHVFLTDFHPDRRRALPAFQNAEWLIAEGEREAAGVPMAQALKRLAETKADLDEAGEALSDDQKTAVEVVQMDIALLSRFGPAPDTIAQGVDLFPLPGVTPGLCGLLIPGINGDTMVCGDAIPTVEHLAQGKILPTAADLDRARESFAEAVEIADWIVPGRDNATPNPTRRPF